MGLSEYSAKVKEATTYSGDLRGRSEATTDSMPRNERERGGAGVEEDVPQTRLRNDQNHVPKPEALVFDDAGFEIR